MEVLKSSEELEKQILEDARKKASRILETADKECVELREEWAKKLAEEGARMDADCDGKIAATREELAASLPLDFMRTRLTYIEETVRGKLEEFFNALSREEASGVIASLVKRVSPAFAGKHVVAYVGGIERAEVEKIMREAVPGAVLDAVKPLPADKSRGIILEAEEGRIRFRGTFDELEETLLDEQREQLVTALLGKEI